MQYNQGRSIKQTFVDAFNKVFKGNSTWVNTDIEVVGISGENSPDVFEQFPWDSEKYPRVVIFAGESQADKWAIDSKICQVRDNITFGTAARLAIPVTTTPLGFAVSSPALPLKLHSVTLTLQHLGPYEENIDVELWSSGSDHPGTKLASGVFKGKSFAGIHEMTVSLRPLITMAPDTNYFIVVTGRGSYNLMVDSHADADTPNTVLMQRIGSTWTIISDSQAFVGTINGAAYQRLGGGISSSIRVYAEAKDLATVQKISDLVFVYSNLARHSNPGRSAKMVDPNTTSTLYDFVSDLTDAGIYIVNIAKGAENIRERGNDRIYSIDVSLNCYSHWTEDFSFPDLDDIETDINGF